MMNRESSAYCEREWTTIFANPTRPSTFKKRSILTSIKANRQKESPRLQTSRAAVFLNSLQTLQKNQDYRLFQLLNQKIACLKASPPPSSCYSRRRTPQSHRAQHPGRREPGCLRNRRATQPRRGHCIDPEQRLLRRRIRARKSRRQRRVGFDSFIPQNRRLVPDTHRRFCVSRGKIGKPARATRPLLHPHPLNVGDPPTRHCQATLTPTNAPPKSPNQGSD